MNIEINGENYNVVILRKPTNKNTYLRVKEDMSLLITTNLFTRDRELERFLNRNTNKILKMIEQQQYRNEINQQFYYLGKCYKITYWEQENIVLGHENIFLPYNEDVDKWLRNQAKKVFQKHLNYIYNIFTEKIEKPTLKIRKMKTRWGVCNIKNKTVTLNLELIKKHPKYLDYVIVHELSHLVYPNHSKSFWKIVEKNLPNYKILRNEMKRF